MIYFIRSGLSDDIKIGYTNDVQRRMGELALPDVQVLAAIEGDRQDEASLHKKFAYLRIDKRKEWFSPGPDLMAFIGGRRGDGGALGVAELWTMANKLYDEVMNL